MSYVAQVQVELPLLDVAQEVCDRLAILNHGEIVAQGSYSEIRSEAHPNAKGLEEVFLRILEEESNLIIPKDAQ